METAKRREGWTVTAAGTGINLALGVLYTWSIFKGEIKRSIESGGAGGFDWKIASLNDPYAVCCLVFALMMIVAGRSQDRLGPRLTAMIGGVLVGLGFLLISFTTAYTGWIFGFGLLVGSGIAFGYASATPPALKWYPPAMTGRIAGIVVSGFGLASVYIAPLAQYLLSAFGLSVTMRILGIAFLLVVTFLALFLVNPPEGYKPPEIPDRRRSATGTAFKTAFTGAEVPPGQVIRSLPFWELWLLYFIGAGAGLMVIGSVAGMARASLGENAFWAVAILAVGNAGGRIAAGILSDRIGRRITLFLVFLFQALLMFAAVGIMGSGTAIPLVLVATLIGFNYGANLALFPAMAKDLWGMKHFGVNYGLLFTAWGIGGFVLSRASQMLSARTGQFTSSFITAAALLAVGALLTLVVRNERDEARRDAAREMAAHGLSR